LARALSPRPDVASLAQARQRPGGGYAALVVEPRERLVKDGRRLVVAHGAQSANRRALHAEVVGLERQAAQRGLGRDPAGGGGRLGGHVARRRIAHVLERGHQRRAGDLARQPAPVVALVGVGQARRGVGDAPPGEQRGDRPLHLPLAPLDRGAGDPVLPHVAGEAPGDVHHAVVGDQLRRRDGQRRRLGDELLGRPVEVGVSRRLRHFELGHLPFAPDGEA
jgi:hypothetical protein